ncbi:MAG TPA: M23 family metallopeptidase [Gemmatimonadaceae bacterium]|nr:M23 family metallopeptidase [Gemmatimonadaceae bacterium]
MKKRPTRATAYLTVALLVLVALRYTPELPDTPGVAHVLRESTPLAVSDFVAPVIASRTETLNRGETLIGLFRRAGVSDVAAQEIVRAASSASIEPRFLRAGMPVEITGDSAGDVPKELVFHLGIDRLLRMRRSDRGWIGVEERLPWTTDTVVVGGTINSTLYQAMNAGASQYFPSRAKDELTWALADIFEYRVDMSRDLQVGDQFKALVERSVGPGGITKVGKVLAASFHLSGSEVSAVLFNSKTASPQYYDATGRSLRAAFLRAPLEFRRISSNFGLRRHPILGRLKAHKGTDYAANAGTPVRAIGDAVVTRAGWAGGYGNVLELRHRNGYVTRYGHLRGFAKGIRPGIRVNIAQTVAYVGTTGLSTAPHLHFEVLIGGVQRDSRVALKSVAGDPILRSERASFDARREHLLASLTGAPGVVRLASR